MEHGTATIPSLYKAVANLRGMLRARRVYRHYAVCNKQLYNTIAPFTCPGLHYTYIVHSTQYTATQSRDRKLTGTRTSFFQSCGLSVLVNYSYTRFQHNSISNSLHFYSYKNTLLYCLLFLFIQ